jgi:hypothetical protein
MVEHRATYVELLAMLDHLLKLGVARQPRHLYHRRLLHLVREHLANMRVGPG